MYFSLFPTVEYFDGERIDITRRVGILNDLKTNPFVYEMYMIKDGDTPESIAYDFYGDAGLFWVILLFNDIVDPINEWVVDQYTLEQKVKKMYGESAIYSTHHYELNGEEVDSTIPGALPVTNLEYESKLNEDRRNIKILEKEKIRQLIDEFESMIKVK